MKLKPYLIIYILLVSLSVNAAGQPNDAGRTLQKLYDRIVFSSSETEKLRLNDSIRLIVESYAASDSVFTTTFTGLRYLGQITSSDKRIKIITWNLLLHDGTNYYYCYLIRKGKRSEGNRVYVLTGSHLPEPAASDKQYAPDNWYGALYYAIEPCRKDYIILGLDFGGRMESRKIIDVLSFTPGGDMILGKDLFARQNQKRFREVIEYSSQSVVSLRFDNPRLIVFDHLAAFSSGDEEKLSLGAGVSFDGYEFKKGTWNFITGVDARNPKK